MPNNILITQTVEGALLTEEVNTPPENIDDESSRILMRSVCATIRNGVTQPQSKAGGGTSSDDKAIVGYTSQGLPFSVVVDGQLGSSGDVTFNFVDSNIIPLIDAYAKKLSASRDAQHQTAIIKEFIREIAQLRQSYGDDNQFTLAIAITFEKNNTKYCAGFSLGDCGLVLKKAESGQIIQLAHHNEIDGFKDGFDTHTYNSTGIDVAITRNSIFVDTAVERGDEILGYTYLTDMEEARQEVSSTSTPVVRKLSLRGQFNNNQLLFAQVVTLNANNYLEKCRALEKTTKLAAESTLEANQKFGDDCTISSITVPSPRLQRKLQILATDELLYDTSEHDTALYDEANKALSTALSQETLPDIRQKISNLQQQVEQMKANSSSHHNPMLIKTLLKTTQLLTVRGNPQKVAKHAEQYVEFGKQVKNAPHSWKRQLLGGLIMALGAAIIAGGILVLLGTAGLGALPSAGMVVGGTALFALGAGITFYKRQQKQLSEKIAELNTAKTVTVPAKQATLLSTAR